ncbi:BrnT family toxin [Duganella sp. HH105]|uniref:BrnT family toxin n=1 Tax=Duganella sp. HH105 TaxID=1781067 RepID=UPI0009000C14
MLTWDENKRRKNLRDHGIDFADLDSVFDLPMYTTEDRSVAYSERRFRSFCLLKDRVVVLIWTSQGDDVRLISCRYGDRRETRTYIQNAPF